jgi:hypothetical protein
VASCDSAAFTSASIARSITVRLVSPAIRGATRVPTARSCIFDVTTRSESTSSNSMIVTVSWRARASASSCRAIRTSSSRARSWAVFVIVPSAWNVDLPTIAFCK